MKKILITGGAGQLARGFFKLYNNKYKIFSFSKNSLDISNYSQVQKILKEIQPEIIVNCAAFTNVDICEDFEDIAYKINGSSIKNFSGFNGHFFHLSTDYVFDGENGPYNEDDSVNPINVYGKSKLRGEEFVENIFEKYTILRTNILFGNDSKSSFLNWVLNSLKNNQEIKVVNDQINNPVSTLDCSRTINYLLNKSIIGKYHLGSDFLCTRYDFAIKIAKIWNLDLDLISEISTEDLHKTLESFKAKRPLKSGLISKFDFIPNYSLENSIKELKNI
tara:strand:- start:1325 stop:2155 length:831 start_codon:yes stop_codon:yes gene_type:complete